MKDCLDWWWKCVGRHFCDFRTRARRREFWCFVFVDALLFAVAWIADIAVGSSFDFARFETFGLGWITTLFAAVMAVPFCAAAFRRMHDTGRSGGKFVTVCVLLAAVSTFAVFVPVQAFLARKVMLSALLYFVSGVFIVMLITLQTVRFCRNSQPGFNRYGLNPKGDKRPYEWM
ncbi:MAG: DUF805 domain-containing protein [Alistipes sp.]|nr:DUF805 domain-containing protein [Alistipes sp.]